MENRDNNTQEQTDDNEIGNRGGFLRFLFIIACGLAFLPAMSIPWNKTVWVDDWNYYEYSSGFFLRALKVVLIAISVITWIVLLYFKYKQMMDDNDKE